MKKIIQVSKRTRLKFSEAEMLQLREYTENPDNAPYATIKKNTKIDSETVKRIVEVGSAERDTALRMRDFLKGIKELQSSETN